MNDSLRRTTAMRSPMNDLPSAPGGRFGLLPSLLQEFFQPENGETRANIPLDIEETETAYHVVADIPGVEKSDIKVELHENALAISAERKEERETEGRPLWRERRGGTFARTVQLPQAVDEENVKANLVNGTLHLTLQKVAAAKAKRIQIA